MNNNEYIPAKQHYLLHWSAWEFYVSQIPSGKCATQKHLLQFLKKVYMDDLLSVDYNNQPPTALRDDSVPMWRLLSATGLVEEDKFFISGKVYARKLRAEGHEIIQTPAERFKVADYKSTQIDYNQLTILPFDDAVSPAIAHPLDSLSSMQHCLQHSTYFDSEGKTVDKLPQ